MNRVFLGLGSNLGNREEILREAIRNIEESCGSLILISSLYVTEPVGFTGGDFLNIVICIETRLTPSGLLGRILKAESQLGRLRIGTGYASRTIDIDILLFDNEIIDSECLVVPHPRMHLRKFVLEPLNEIAGNLLHPVLNKTISELLAECSDKSSVIKFKTKG